MINPDARCVRCDGPIAAEPFFEEDGDHVHARCVGLMLGEAFAGEPFPAGYGNGTVEL